MFRHPSEPLEPHVRRVVHTHLHPVATGRAEPQQPGQQSGGTALPGEQEGVREEGDGHRGAELGGRLRGSTSRPPPPLHWPPRPLSIARSFLPHRDDDDNEKKKIEQLYQKNSSATLKKKEE